MATAQSIINRALRLIGAIATGETPEAAESFDALQTINGMLSTWRNENLIAWTVQEIVAPITGGKQGYTMGTGGDINTERPLEIENARLRWNGVDYPLQVIDQAAWAKIRVKTLTSNLPQYVWPTGDFPLTTLNLWPVPTINMELIVSVPVVLDGFADLFAEKVLPPGYDDLLTYGLAVRLAPEYGVGVPADVAAIYRGVMRGIKRTNATRPTCKMEMATGRRFNIYAGV